MQPRALLNKGLKEIQDEVLIMGSMVEKALGLAMDSMKNRDLELAEKIISDDDKVDKKRALIEEKCIQLIATQQPMATDLRFIVAVLNIIIDLERIADYAEGIARITIMIGDEPLLKPLIDLPRMTEKTQNMLHRALDSFVRRDTNLARQICKEDDEVDNLYKQVFNELLFFMISDPRTVNRATRLIWAAHNLERSADRVTNICERVVYIVTGKTEELGASKDG